MSRRLSEKAYHLIKKKIIMLDMLPSQVIDEQELMSSLDLGRTPIREALLQLAKEDLVTIVPRRGMFVSDISITDLQKIFEVRVVLEGLCARLAAARATNEQVAEMEALLDQLETISNDDVAALMESDSRFHELLYQSADNEFLCKMLERLYAPSLRLWHLVLERLSDVKDAIEQHRKIVEAVKVGDGDRAEAFIRQHVLEFQREIKSVL
jgi:DNA-binding GntR family transcriptional regulator